MGQPEHHEEFPYSVRIETATGQSARVPIAFMNTRQLETFLQTDFKRLVEGAGVKGARIHIERAVTADYEKVLQELAACLHSAALKAA